MRLPRQMRIAFAAPVLSFALFTVPALAHDGPPPPPPVNASFGHPGPAHPAHAGQMMSPEARSSWLAECHSRAGKHRKRTANSFCESYLDDYYARYSAPQPYYGYQGATYGYPAYSNGCCNAQPMMLVPIVRAPNPERGCKEVVEYEYVDVPVRPTPARRSIPDKRVKIVPDKRIPVK